MNQLFIRLYGLVVVATIAAIAGGFVFLGTRVLPERNQNLAELLAPTLRDLARSVDAGGPTALDDVAREVGPALALLPPDVVELEPADRAALARGEVLVLGNELERYAYALVPSSGLLLELELLGLDGRIVQWGTVVARTPPDREVPYQGTLSAAEHARVAHRPIAVAQRTFAPAGLLVYQRDGALYQLEIETDGPQDIRLQVLGGMLLLLAVAVILPLRPLHRQLGALGRTVDALAAGDTRARVPLVSGGALVHPVAEQFNRMAQEIEDALARNQELLRSVAHEMRTPLARLLLALDLLDGDAPDARAQRIAKLQRTVVGMQELTDELLEFSRLGDHPTVGRAPVDLVEVATEVAGRWEGTTVESPASPVIVPADRTLVVRAVDNAVSNAVRYASAPVVRFEQSATGWAVLVDDAGPGIAEDERERIFEPFERLEASRSRDTGGTGLGLAIVRRIMRAHGGDARIQRSPEGGTRVRLRWEGAP